MESLRSFRDLKCWKEAVELRQRTRTIIQRFPTEERFRLTDQLIRALRSVTNNLAEGFGRFHYQETIQFSRHSRGSLYEVQDHFFIALEEGYLTDPEYNELNAKAEGCIALVNGYISYLKKAKVRDAHSVNG